MPRFLANGAELSPAVTVIVIGEKYEERGVSALADTPRSRRCITNGWLRPPNSGCRSSLVPLKQIPRVHLVRHVRELVAPAVGHDNVAAGLEGLQVVRHLGPEELRRVQRGLVDHHGHALGLHALHYALDGARAEVVGVRLHRQAVNAHDRLRLALVDAVPHHLQHLVGHEVLAGAVGLHDGLDQVLRHVPVVGQQLLGVLGQAVAAVAEAGVVVMAADARLQAHAVDDVAGVEAADLAVGVELVEVGHAQRQVGVGEELDRLGLGGAQNELGDALRAVGVDAIQLRGVGALREQAGELLRRGDGLGVVLRCAHHDAAGVQVVVERLALTQELRAEEDLAVAQPLAQARGVADGDGRLDDDPGARVHRAHGGDSGLDGARVEEVPIGVVVGGSGDDGVVGARVGLRHVDGGVQVELALPRLCLREEALDLVVLDGRYVVVDLLDLLGHDVQRVDLVVLREQDGEGQADVAGTGDSDLHVILQLSKNSNQHEKWPQLQGHDLLNVVVALIPLGEGPQAVLERRRGLVTQVALERRGVGVGDGHVAWLHGHELLVGLEVVVRRQHALLHQHAL